MEKKKKKIVVSKKMLLSALIINALIIGITIILSVQLYRSMIKIEEENCWMTLEDSAKSVEDLIQAKIEDNINVLKLASKAMVKENRIGDDEDNLTMVRSHLEDFLEMTIFNHVDILYADGDLLIHGTEMYPSDMNFDEIAAKGVHISRRVTDVLTGKEAVVCAVPIIQEEKTVAMLCGIILCEDFPKIFDFRLYDGKAFLTMIDRASGDFIMDSWHDTFGNVKTESPRQVLPGYENIDIATENLAGHRGVVAFKSKTNGRVSYMYFQPVGDLGWQMSLVVQEQIIFSRVLVMKRLWTYMIIIEVILLVSYLIWTTWTLNNALKGKAESDKQRYVDSLTGIYNRNKFNQILNEYQFMKFDGIGIMFLDLNHLKYINDHQGHEAGDQLIRHAATILSRFFGSTVYRIGGDEFVASASNISEEQFKELADCVKKEMAAEGVDIASGITWQKDTSSIQKLIQDADRLMYMDKQNYYKRISDDDRLS